MSSREAQAIANSKNLDLVKISPNAKPPVCKIMDYGKYKYEQSRKEKEDKVKVELRFRGRELGHKDIGKEVMIKFIDIVKEFGEPTKAPAFEGNNMVVIIDPKK